MTAADAHAVGLRDLRHHTSEVLARVRHGETIDVTEAERQAEEQPGDHANLAGHQVVRINNDGGKCRRQNRISSSAKAPSCVATAFKSAASAQAMCANSA